MERYQRLTFRFALQLAAPHTWAASLCPALFGELWCAEHGFPLSLAQNAALLLACAAMQSAVNTLNDYYDFQNGTDSVEDFVEETDAAILYGHLNPAHVLALGCLYLLSGAALGIAGCLRTGPIALAVGVAGGLVVMAYSGGPCPLSHLPVGEVVSGFVMGGLIPLGIAAAATNRLCPEILPETLPLIIGIALIMMTNNGCDREKDHRAGRRTLPVLLGRERTVRLYRGLAAAWIALLCVLALALHWPVGLAEPALLYVLAGRAFRVLLCSELRPEERIKQMKTVTAANLLGNGSLLLIQAAGLLAAAIR